MQFRDSKSPEGHQFSTENYIKLYYQTPSSASEIQNPGVPCAKRIA